ncbi:MAG: trigger factor [Flavobacteriales bacterium]|jgi:trigger factor|nr:trigger factor [Flavobacteriales bacterium]|tara:strand:+ start:8242 stop:9594 length:1353 start_codon:yes stop_codon:yes gene_type:complete
MKITQSKVKKMMSSITVEVEESDYIGKVDTTLKKYRKDAVIPGFRKGKTPMSIISKQYKVSVVVDEVNKMIQDELYKHITDNKVRVLGSPMPMGSEEIDWVNSVDFKFEYEIGLAPEFDVKLGNKDSLNYYNITAEAKLVDNYCTDIAKRYGKMSNPEVSEKGDMVFCTISQLDVNGVLMENGISNDATVSIDVIVDKKNQKKFIGLKKDDHLILNVVSVFENKTDLAAMLNISAEELTGLVSEEFQFTVKQVNRLAPSELNPELFAKVYKEESIKDVKAFKAKIKEEAENSFIVESDRMLKNDVVTFFINKTKLKLPDEFLKRWLVKTSEKPLTMEQVEQEYDMYSKSLKWQLIENKILEEHEIKINNEDLLEHTKKMVAFQMKQYGQPSTDEKQLLDISENILKNDDERKKISDQLFDERTLVIYKEIFKLKNKSISYDDFVKLASEK